MTAANFSAQPTIAIVDDDPRIRRLLEEELTDEGVSVVSLTDGFQLLEQITGSAIDLILLDLMMPQLDGIETLRRLKRINSHIPVIVFTALSDSDKRREALDLGATEYILKPDLFENLPNIIKRHLGEKRL